MKGVIIMKRIASVILTGALILSMGAAAFAATPSKTVADEIKADVAVETTGFDRVSISTEETEATVAQSAEVVKELASSTEELKETVGATAEEKIEVIAVRTVTSEQTPLFNRTKVTASLSSAVIDAACTENEQVTVLVMVPVVGKDGTVTYEKIAVTSGVVKDGKVQVKLTGALLKKIGKRNVTLVAIKKIAKV